MQKIVIHNLGPINDCSIELNSFTVLTGTQASGKSTLSKSIFLFKNIADILYKLVIKTHLGNENTNAGNSLRTLLVKERRTAFLDTFGSTWCMSPDMQLAFEYNDGKSIKITLQDTHEGHNYIWVDFSQEVINFLRQLEASNVSDQKELPKMIRSSFGDFEEAVYIPAGRSLMTLLSSQLDYIYSVMDDEAKRGVDYCTKNYIERILRIKGFFSGDYARLIAEKNTVDKLPAEKRAFLEKLAKMIQKILKGKYVKMNSEERLEIAPNRYVKINYASSGQQEIVWILNVLFYYVINDRRSFFIVEEPEAHLYPDAQKLVAQFLALVANAGNSMLITTHSPYILAEINNLLYADKMQHIVDKVALSEIVCEDEWLDFDKISAYFLSSGNVKDCRDKEFRLIMNEVIDGASDDINAEFDRIAALQDEE